MLKKNKGKREKTMADDGRHWSGEFGASAAVTPKGGIVGRKPLAMALNQVSNFICKCKSLRSKIIVPFKSSPRHTILYHWLSLHLIVHWFSWRNLDKLESDGLIHTLHSYSLCSQQAGDGLDLPLRSGIAIVPYLIYGPVTAASGDLISIGGLVGNTAQNHITSGWWREIIHPDVTHIGRCSITVFTTSLPRHCRTSRRNHEEKWCGRSPRSSRLSPRMESRIRERERERPRLIRGILPQNDSDFIWFHFIPVGPVGWCSVSYPRCKGWAACVKHP